MIGPIPPRAKITLDYAKIADVELAGIERRDSPKFVDAFIESASYDGRDMTDAELDVLNNDSGYVFECVQKRVY